MTRSLVIAGVSSGVLEALRQRGLTVQATLDPVPDEIARVYEGAEGASNPPWRR